jgi:hypothetical protein
MTGETAALTAHFAPLIGGEAMLALLAASAVALILSALFYRRGLLWRALCLIAFLMIFLNPSLVEEDRQPVPDVAVIVADRSPSQHIGDRWKRTDVALAALKAKLQGNKNIELRVVDAPAAGNPLTRETRLFDAADQAFADVPLARRAGLILLTDGEVHDVPTDAKRLQDYGPISTLLTGEHHERDRQLVILEAPAYGIVGQTVTIKYRIEDTAPGDSTADVTTRANSVTGTQTVPVGEDQQMTVTIDHPGQNVFDIAVAPLPGEITLANNRAPVIVNGVRDRLRVLLVSGQPYNGGRTWRDMLTSDPGVDLVEFTILREPDKLDMTPQNELALIPFPFHELFDVKLYDFDLIIFDRYKLNRILPDYYFPNIVKYVQDGGALLEASGPSFETDESIDATALKSVLPASPTGEVMEQPFRPTLTPAGQRHPVTQGLHWEGEDPAHPQWGRWLRQVGVTVKSGDVLMTGVDNKPLLILDRVGKGRVAQLASDQIWLWSRGYDGGGPYTELMRRLAHWLMKEPELEENALDATIDNGALTVKRHTLSSQPMDVKITRPDGSQQTLTLAPSGDGLLQGRAPADQLGIYTVDDGTQQRFAISGELNPPELRRVVTTPDILAPAVKASHGATIWLADTPRPDLRLLPPGRDYGGRAWVGLRSSNSFNVTGVRERPVLPMGGWAVILLGILITAWWIEGRARRRFRAK